MSVVYNARGTSVPFFTIGKQGVTIFQGSADPQLTYTIKNGDIWINDSTHAISSWYSGTSSWGPPAAGYLKFPLTDGTNGQVLATNALGQLSFVSTVDNVTGVVAIANGGSGQTTANAALNAFLPSQIGNENKGLVTDGTNTSWQTEYPTGGNTDKVFYENMATVSNNYTITANYNAMSAGPITIDAGVTVTVPVGSVWTVV